MRLLWIKMGGLWPATSGGRIRSLQTLSRLSTRHQVTVVTTHGPDDDRAELTRQLPHCARIVSLPFTAPKSGSAPFARALAGSWLSRYPVDLWKWRVPGMREEIERLVAQDPVDICVADFLVATANLPDRNGIPVVLFEHNVEHVVWQRLARLERRVAHRAALEIEWRKLRAYEADACATADLTIAVSEEDRRTLSALARGARTTSVPTGVDTEYFAPGGRREIPGRLVFTGSMDWHPNEDAVIHFSETILPLIRARARFARLPEISFTVVGRNPGPRLAGLSRMGVTVTGTVPDVRPFIDEAALYVVPLRAGGGTRLKIFEALAMGKAVVSTSVGAEGLGLTADKEIVFADDPVEFADAVVSLLRDPPTRERLGHAGRTLVESAFSWDHAVRTFETHCESVIARRSLHHMRAQRVPPAVLNRRESI